MGGGGAAEDPSEALAFTRVDVLGHWALGDDSDYLSAKMEAAASASSTDAASSERKTLSASSSCSSGVAAAAPQLEVSPPHQVAECAVNEREGLAQPVEGSLLSTATERIKEHYWAVATEMVHSLSQGTLDHNRSRSFQSTTDGGESEGHSTTDEEQSPWDRVLEARQQAAERVQLMRQGMEQVRAQACSGVLEAAQRVRLGRSQPPQEQHETFARTSAVAGSSEEQRSGDDSSESPWDRVQEATQQAAERVEQVRLGVEQVRAQACWSLVNAAERVKLGLAQAAKQAQSGPLPPAAASAAQVPASEEAHVARHSSVGTAPAQQKAYREQPLVRPFWEVAIAEEEAQDTTSTAAGHWLDVNVLSDGLGIFRRGSLAEARQERGDAATTCA